MLSQLLVMYSEDCVLDACALNTLEVHTYALKDPLSAPPSVGKTGLLVLDIQSEALFESLWPTWLQAYGEQPLVILLGPEMLLYVSPLLSEFPHSWDWFPRQADSLYLEAKFKQCWQNGQSNLLHTEKGLDSLLHLINGPISPLEGYLDMLQDGLPSNSVPASEMVLQAVFCLKKLKQRIYYLELYRLLQSKRGLGTLHNLDLQELLSDIQERLMLGASSQPFVLNQPLVPTHVPANKELLERMLLVFLNYLSEHYQQVQVEIKQLSQARLQRRLAYPQDINQALGFVQTTSLPDCQHFLELHFQFQGPAELALIWIQFLQHQPSGQDGWLESELLSRLNWEGLYHHQAWVYVEATTAGVNHLSWGLPLLSEAVSE